MLMIRPIVRQIATVPSLRLLMQSKSKFLPLMIISMIFLKIKRFTLTLMLTKSDDLIS